VVGLCAIDSQRLKNGLNSQAKALALDLPR